MLGQLIAECIENDWVVSFSLERIMITDAKLRCVTTTTRGRALWYVLRELVNEAKEKWL